LEAVAVLPAAKGFLVDLDGTLITGRTVLPWARELIERIGPRSVVMSNDSEHTPDQLARLLRSLRLPISADRIVLAGALAVDAVAAKHAGARVLLLGSESLRTYARRRGLELVANDPQVILLARDRRFTYAKLALATNALLNGAALIVANPDRTHPGAGGKAVPETGAILSAILACTGSVGCEVIGKPEPHLFARGMAMLGTCADETVMIGDNPETDGLGAARAGMRYVHVLEILKNESASSLPALVPG